MTGLEEAFAALVLAALTRWLLRISRKVMFPWTAWRQIPDPQAALSEQDLWSREVDRLVTWLARRAVDARVEEMGATGPKSAISTSAEVNRHLGSVRNLLARIPQEAFEDIRRQILIGHQNGEPVKTIAGRIDEILRVSGSENWPNRARTIAVTEVNGASNAGWFAAAAQMQQQFGPMSKKWLAAHDSNVRLEHRAADGQVVPLSQPFIVGGEPLMYPGDKAGSPWNIINCRCTAATVET